jgi:hypothetical protein
MDDSRTPMVTAPVDLILSNVALEAIALCAQTRVEATNAALMPDTRNDDAFIFKLLVVYLLRTVLNYEPAFYLQILIHFQSIYIY